MKREEEKKVETNRDEELGRPTSLTRFRLRLWPSNGASLDARFSSRARPVHHETRTMVSLFRPLPPLLVPLDQRTALPLLLFLHSICSLYIRALLFLFILRSKAKKETEMTRDSVSKFNRPPTRARSLARSRFIRRAN